MNDNKTAREAAGGEPETKPETQPERSATHGVEEEDGLCVQCIALETFLSDSSWAQRFTWREVGVICCCRMCAFLRSFDGRTNSVRFISSTSQKTFGAPSILDTKLYKATGLHRELGEDDFRCTPELWEQWLVPYHKEERDQDEIPRINTATIDQNKADLDKARRWIAFCQKHHLSDCAKARNTPHATSSKLMVIDCMARKLVLLPDACPYVALSYVWGLGLSDDSDFGSIRDELPRVVEDAIVVARELRIPYLWVDRYCINQDNEAEKLRLLRNMDLVYNNADVTIIAAGGAGPESGLFGVSGPPRRSQKQIKTNHIHLMAFADPQFEVQRSVWSSRGWTYQEGLLSRRRLLFTESQAYFQCLGMSCFEVFDIPLEYCFARGWPGDQARLGETNLPITVFPIMASQNPRSLYTALTEYMPRQFTVEEDVLDAFRGVFAAYQQNIKVPVFHFWGIPLLVSSESTPLAVDQTFAMGLAWLATDITQQGRRYVSIRKRAGSCLPSWTWAAYKADRLEIFVTPSSGACISAVSVVVSPLCGARISLSAYAMHIGAGGDFTDFHPWVDITGWTSPGKRLADGEELHVDLPKIENSTFEAHYFVPVYRSGEGSSLNSPAIGSLIIPDKWRAFLLYLVLGHSQGQYWRADLFFLLISDHGDNTFKRCGLLQVFCRNETRQLSMLDFLVAFRSSDAWESSTMRLV